MRATFVGLFLAVSLSGSIALAQTSAPPLSPPVNPPRVQILPPRAATTVTCTQADCDGDGSRSIASGGSDCDDNDRDRYPGHNEIFDGRGHDEDCNPETFGVRDTDADGYPDDVAYNTAPDGRVHRGNDCDDGRPDVRPDAQELPNRVDDDCDGVVDDLLGVWYTPPTR